MVQGSLQHFPLKIYSFMPRSPHESLKKKSSFCLSSITFLKLCACVSLPVQYKTHLQQQLTNRKPLTRRTQNWQSWLYHWLYTQKALLLRSSYELFRREDAVGLGHVADHVVLLRKGTAAKRANERFLSRVGPHVVPQVGGNAWNVPADAAELGRRAGVAVHLSLPNVCAWAPLFDGLENKRGEYGETACTHRLKQCGFEGERGML